MTRPSTGRHAAPSHAVRAAGTETPSTTLARIASHLDADRVEVHGASAASFSLLARWCGPLGSGQPVLDRAEVDPVDASWFPWGLANIRPEAYVFVRNAGSLLVREHGGPSLADASIGSSLHVPLCAGGVVIGALCAMWHEERSDWAADRLAVVTELARSVLDVLA